MPRAQLDEAGIVSIDGVTLEAPGARGNVSVERGAPKARARRGTGGPPANAALDRAMSRSGMRTTKTAVIAATRMVRRGSRKPEPITLTVDAPRAGREQVVLTIENGIAMWHTSRESRSPRAVRRTGATKRTYVIPQVQPSPEHTTRGGFPLSTIIRVITFPVSQAVGKVARFAARRWDLERHPPQVRAYGPGGKLSKLTAADWKRLASGPTLMFVHGTFSTTEGAFSQLPEDTRKKLYDRYGGRVIAYDHPTIADDPFVNARKFFELVGDRKLEIDIVCHSRGGLVARSIAERPGDLADLGKKVRVRRIVLIGVLSNGTILADAENWGELLDRFTTLLHLVPAPGVVDTLETVLAIVKSIAIKTAQDLEGLSAMTPGSPFLKKLNAGAAKPGDATYLAVTSNFEPRDPHLKAWLNDEVRDWIFKNQSNDMMVTIDSMTGKNGSGRFPIEPDASRGFVSADAVEHAQYFGQPLTSTALLEWFAG
jgi:pimeloyl-ACP methyl ester carboxylesterase